MAGARASAAAAGARRGQRPRAVRLHARRLQPGGAGRQRVQRRTGSIAVSVETRGLDVIYQLDLPLDVVAHSHSDAARSAAQLAETVASALREAIDSHGRASLVVSGGRSPLAFFQCLSRQDLDWSKVVVSLADERWVDPRSTQSNEYLVTHYLLQGRAASAAFIGLYQPAGSPDVAALAADAALEELPQPIDVLVLGMGEDGHTASLFAGSPN